jgi:hypothetical protein
MNRRTFGKLIGAGAVDSMAKLERFPQASALPNQTERRAAKSPTQTYRRIIVDMHVPDWDPVLLSCFDPEDYVRTIADAGFELLLMYAQSEVGLCFYPTKVGQMHAALKGRDFLGEVVHQCRRRSLSVLAYFSLTVDNWAYQTHPDWRVLPEDGYDRTLEAPQGRYGIVCPNSPYRDYVLACMKEIVSNYDIDGMFLDEYEWRAVCYCPYCTARFWREYKSEPPRIVDWDDPTWRQFQKMREQSFLDFGLAVYRTIKQVRPITVCYNYGTFLSPWQGAVPLELNQASDYASGDFDGNTEVYSLACKGFDSLTRSHPYDIIISVSESSRLSLKPNDQLRIQSLTTTLHSAPLMFIDGILPDGTLYKPFYEVFAHMNALLAQYQPFLGGELLADVAIYYDKASMYDPAHKGVDVSQLENRDVVPHRDGMFGMARILRGAHIPFGIVTNITLEQLSRYRAVVLPNVLELTSEQAAQFRSFVEQGGILYASGPSSLDRFDPHGPRFLLEDVLGVRYKGRLGTVITYFTPKDEKVKQAIWQQMHIKFEGSMVRGEALPGAEVLATVTLPFPPIESEHVIGSHFTDIESDQPALTPGSDPALVQNAFGKGRAVWLSAPLESTHSNPEEVNTKLVLSVLRRVFPGPYWFEADTHPSVEVTLYHQRDRKRLLAGLLNMQQQLPPIPVGATVRVQVPTGRRATRVISVPAGREIPFEKAGPYTQFRVPPFEALSMAFVEYE